MADILPMFILPIPCSFYIFGFRVLGLGVSGLSVGVWGLGFCGLGVGFILVLAKCDWQNVADPLKPPPCSNMFRYVIRVFD